MGIWLYLNAPLGCEGWTSLVSTRHPGSCCVALEVELRTLSNNIRFYEAGFSVSPLSKLVPVDNR